MRPALAVALTRTGKHRTTPLRESGDALLIHQWRANLVRRLGPGEPPDDLEIGAEKLVEHRVFRRGIPARIPPEPIASFGHHQRLPDAFRHDSERAPLLLREPPRALERAPGTLVRRLANPYPQARFDPGPRVQVGQLDLRRILLEELGDPDGLEALVGLKPSVERPEEVVAVVRVLLPRVLTVKDDRGEVRAALIRQAVAGALELGDHVADRVLRLHVAIYEADPIAELAIAKDHRHAVPQAVRPVEEPGLEQRADLVAFELDVHRSREHPLVRREPGEAGLLDRVRRFRRDRALRGPDAARLRSEGALVRRDRLLELERGVVGIGEWRIGQLGRWIGAQGGLGVDEERKDRGSRG